VRHDLRKFCFSNRVRTLWNSLPDIVVKAESVNKDWTDSGKIGELNLIGKLTRDTGSTLCLKKRVNFVSQSVVS